MKHFKLLTMLFALLAFAGLSACENDGPLEEAGEDIEEAVDEAGDDIEEAVDDIDD